MRLITVRIDDDQFEKLKSMEKAFRMKGISCLIRRAIDIYLESFPYGDELIEEARILKRKESSL